MEKLIELLNKHRREKVNKQSGITEWHYNAFTFSLDNISGQQAELLIISKQYGFIKRLVDNDKIDTSAYKTVYSGDLDKRKTLTMSSGGDEFYQVIEHGVYESLLMLLSIQDEPINFLISILK